MVNTQQGFTTVELIVTLAVGVLFLMSGYQLYGAISLRSGEARSMSEASNIGYEVLRQEGAYKDVSVACSATASSHDSTSITDRTSPTLSNLEITILRCKPISSLPVVRTTVVVKYGLPQREVVHATYVSS